MTIVIKSVFRFALLFCLVFLSFVCWSGHQALADTGPEGYHQFPPAFAPRGFIPEPSTPNEAKSPSKHPSRYVVPYPIKKYVASSFWFKVSFFPNIIRYDGWAAKRMENEMEGCLRSQQNRPNQNYKCTRLNIAEETVVGRQYTDNERFNIHTYTFRTGRINTKIYIHGHPVLRHDGGPKPTVVSPVPSDDNLLRIAVSWHQAYLNYVKAKGWPIHRQDPDQTYKHKPRKPVTLSGGNDTIALQDALKSQGIGEEKIGQSETSTPSDDQPIDEFDAWKRDHEDRGWRYVEKDGFAEFEPQEGARDSRGWFYSEEKGDFVPPPDPEQIASSDGQKDGSIVWDSPDKDMEADKLRQPKDGDENANGEIWSDEDGGWVGRNLYEQEKERRARIKEMNERPSQQDEDVKKLHDTWSKSRQDLKDLPKLMQDVAKEKKRLDKGLEEQIAKETDSARISFLRDLQDQLADVDVADRDGVLGNWESIMEGQSRDTYEPDYSMKQFIAETGAMTLDTFLTRGAAMASLHSYNAALKEAAKEDATTGSILWEGTTEGIYQGSIGYVLNKVAAGAFSKAKAMREAAKAAKAADDAAIAATKAGKVKGNWNSSSKAIREETQKKLLDKLPSNHPARQIGKINETLGKAGKQFDARKISPHMRLDPNSPTYKAGIDALKKNPRYLSEKAKKVTDAVRHDLDLAAREAAVKEMYKAHPNLKGKLTHFENTGSHARKGLNYRQGASDIDFTPKGTVTSKATMGADGKIIPKGTPTPEGKMAEELFPEFYGKQVKKLSGGKLSTKDLKAHAYGGDKGTGAFQTKLGLKTKDVMNQTSGRIDKLDPTGKITHSLRGDDVIEVGDPTRLFKQGTSQQIAKSDVTAFRKDLVNKFRQELPEMATNGEKLTQAAKGYKLMRIIESKAPGGRPLSANRGLYQMSKQIKNRLGGMNETQMKAMTEKFLKGIEQGK